MTALWIANHGFGDSTGGGDSWFSCKRCGNNGGDGWGLGSGNGNGDGDEYGNGDGGGNELGGYPEQDYDGCNAIGRLLVYETTLPVADLLALAVTR